VDHGDVRIVRTTDLQDTRNAVVVEVASRVGAAGGLQHAARVAALTAKTMDLQGTDNVAVVVAHLVADQQERHVTGIAAVERAEENGRHLAQIWAASFLGALPNACLTMRLLGPSVTRREQPSSLLQQREIPSGRAVVVAANASCSLHLLVGR